MAPNCPAAQAVQAAAPPVAKRPASHEAQAEAAEPEYWPPGQATQLEAPVLEKVPAAHEAQAADPEAEIWGISNSLTTCLAVHM